MNVNLLGKAAAEFSSHLTGEANTVGVISPDRSAVIGHAGWCFIYEGSNNYRAGYINRDTTEMGCKWVNLVEQRQRIADTLGVKFLQVIIPNKLSVLPDYFPEQLDADVTFILQNFLSSERAASLLMPLDTFRQEGVRDTVFRRNDSHFTVAGNALLTEFILAKLGVSAIQVSPAITRRSTHKGDLGGKFSTPVEENLAVPAFDQGLLDQSGIKKVREIISSSFTGTQQVFVNPNAPIKAKILVFGNSFFERVPSWGMSPFFAALFSEFHFIWDANIDFEYVSRARPDYVIAQTCERFMSKLPLDQYV